MTASQEMSMETELLKEVETYLPEMRGFLHVLATDGGSQNDDTVKELHRMTHSIRGAASMVHLSDLSKTAGLMEDVLDTLLEKKRDWNEDLIDVMNQTIDSIGLYCTAMYKGTADGAVLYNTALQIFKPINSLPLASADDEESIGDDDFLALLDGDSEEGSTDDLFQALFDEKDEGGVTDGLVIPPGATDTVSKNIDLSTFLAPEEDESEEDSTKDRLESFLGVTESDPSESLQGTKEEAPLLQPSGIDPDLLESFNEEAEEHLDNIGRQLNELSSTVSNQVRISDEYRESLHSILRSVHTIKGAASVIGIEPVANWGHALEDFLDGLHDESDLLSPEGIVAMQDGADILEKIVADPAVDVSAEIIILQAVFPGVMADLSSGSQTDREESSTQVPEVDTEKKTLPDFFDRSAQDNDLDSFLGIESDDSAGDELDMLLDTADNDSNEVPQDILSLSVANPELQESFDEEAEEHLENIGKQLNELSLFVNGQTVVSEEYREKLHSIRRSVHTLKGAAAVIGIEPVASWGHEFEDFLDNLHDNSDTFSPESIDAMQDGTDILGKIAADPTVDVTTEISILQAVFLDVMASSIVTAEPPEIIEEENMLQTVTATIQSVAPLDGSGDADEQTQSIDEDLESEQVVYEEPGEDVVIEETAPLRITGSRNKHKQLRKSTLRVGSEKIAELMGLGGDMAINLSSFEDSTFSMQSNLDEFELTLKRLKGIASSLEAGYELATIPHLGSTSDDTQGEFSVMDEFDPLEMDRYSELHILIRSLNETIVDLDSIREQASGVQSSWKQAIERQRVVVGEVQGSVNSIQMTPFSTLGNRLYKTVRESARTTGKKIRLLIEGGSIEMDTSVWDVLVDALMHMLRNCVDHGIESAEVRQQLEKPDQATIRIDCSRQGSRFILRLSDDGSGLNYDAIRSRGISLYPDSGVEQMDNNGLAALIFKQGFSVRQKVTTMSGRGVGMDVVRTAIEQLNGFIEVQSTPGQGIEFTLSMPIVVAQLPALMVMFGTQQFAVPMRDVNTVLRLSAEEMQAGNFQFENEQLSLLWPVDLLGLKHAADVRDGRSDLQQNPIAFVVETGGKRGVLMADAVLGQRDIVFKNLGSHLQNIPCVAGATILGDGSLVPILQTEDLFHRAETIVRDDDAIRPEKKEEEKLLEILIADDSISVRMVLSNFVAAQGWQARIASDGVDAMEKIRERKPDLVLLDIEMPRMNGFEVLQAMQSQSAYRDVPVLMLTSRSAAKYREKATELGASGFVTKPFKDEELLFLINGLTVHKTAKGDLQ